VAASGGRRWPPLPSAIPTPARTANSADERPSTIAPATVSAPPRPGGRMWAANIPTSASARAASTPMIRPAAGRGNAGSVT
jgi:hypothetical protein